ncbi:protein-export membrane protein SecD [Neisseria bacilliformis ATCC BAA-1200]|uniref:Protein translocase subunit SecD n=1 Tax=Neisseria bacilliformis ATCC BAA-1200 TaxID=888742 RepID=F2BF55_9NEIS|nr:protein translocase subunit SecD [Neisseria bacilliformis]EGF08927.1 protein-export membrane protein SecD [Neisseria bacilliformis ATCC BAA-1200]QMT46993.1 protein translocase subunit SecD [Neisseria bacilliformis]
MNRYPLWKYLLVTAVLALGLLYTLPNFFGDTLAVQISTNRHSLAIDSQTEARVAQALKTAGIADDGMFIADGSLKVRFKDSQTQMKARSVIESALGEGYITALNQIANTPDWMAKIRANPMFLGLDLRGGVHFTMQVDMKAAMQKTFERYAGDIRRELAKQKIRSGQAVINDNSLSIPFQDAAELENVLPQLQRLLPEATLTTDGSRLVLTLSEQALANIRKQAVEQNITTLHNRVNELGVAEPVIQQAGADRIAVQLPGVQDTAKAKDIIGRTATLEVRMVNEDQAALQAALDGNVPEGYELLKTAGDRPQPLLISKQVELTGDNIDDAQPGQNDKGLPGVNVSFDNVGAEIFADLTRNNVGKGMAMVLVEQGKAEVVTAPTINEPIPNGKTIISGSMSLAEAQDISLLLRAGSLAAPMEIVEERTIGASLGAENIQKGVHSTLWGFAAVAVFMMFYYRLMGFFSVLALAANILLLVAALSFLHATLTLPGIAAMALTLGMAIDSNVLINERIREELRDGMKPQAAIAEGYKHAWDTIVDSNITSLIAGIALLLFGSGPVRGFAVVHCIGILTSMFSSVVVSRMFVNLWYGRRRKLQSISIGGDIRPAAAAADKE